MEAIDVCSTFILREFNRQSFQFILNSVLIMNRTATAKLFRLFSMIILGQAFECGFGDDTRTLGRPMKQSYY